MSDFELIEKYLSGKLSAEEKKAFRNRLLNDPAFNQEFQELKDIRLSVKQKARQDVKDLFNEFEMRIEKEETTKDQTVMKKVISIAASIVLIAAITYVGLTNSSSLNNQELYDKHYTTYNNLAGQVRGVATEALTLEQQAMVAYDAGNFEAATEALSQVVTMQPSAMNYFYLGVSQMEIGESEEAIKSLNSVVNNFSTFKEQARWYLALAHLKNNDEKAALGNLAHILVNKSEYKEKAEAILEDMGLSFDETEMDNGPVVQVEQRPRERNTPDGSDVDNTLGQRRYQFGVVTNLAGDKEFQFMTDDPIEDLTEGDLAVFMVFEKSKGKGRSKMGWAFVLDKM